MAYVLTVDITAEYVASLIERNGFTDVTASHLDWDEFMVIQDLNGGLSAYNDLQSARDYLVLQYVIQQNS